jgi:hypothetical protein
MSTWGWIVTALVAWIILGGLTALLLGPRIKKREIAEHVKGYREGRRLMRHGDGADEWIGMSLTKKHLLALLDLGYGPDGNKVDAAGRAEILRQHGLK